MKNEVCRSLVHVSILALLLGPAPGVADQGLENARTTQSFTVLTGVAGTGPNRRAGAPIWDLPVLGQEGLEFVAEYAPGSSAPLPLSPATSPQAVLATTIDPNDLLSLGIDPASVDPALLNVPLNEVAIIVDPAGNRAQVPAQDQLQGAFGASKSLPNKPVTLRRWLQARGIAHVRCLTDGTAWIRFDFERLLPHGLYTISGIFLDPAFGPIPMPLGGVPNAVVADRRGDVKLVTRRLNFCPTDPEAALVLIHVEYHSDGNTYGAVPAVPFAGLPWGTVTHTQLMFSPTGAARVDKGR